MTFNPNEHLSKLRGKAGDYLEVKWRLVWFRDLHPHGEVSTELIHFDLEKGIAIFKAVIIDGEGGIASGHGSETAKDFGDYLEKAETKAIGRALAALGYGTQFAPELEEGNRIVDSPVAANGNKPKAPTYKDIYTKGQKKGLWAAGSGFYAFASALLGEPISQLNVQQLTPEQLVQVDKAVEEEQAKGNEQPAA